MNVVRVAIKVISAEERAFLSSKQQTKTGTPTMIKILQNNFLLCQEHLLNQFSRVMVVSNTGTRVTSLTHHLW